MFDITRKVVAAPIATQIAAKLAGMGKGWISLMAYQARGYSYIAP